MMYTQDYDETFHKGSSIVSTGDNGFGPNAQIDGWDNWPWYYGRYVKNVAIFDCPTSPDNTLELTKSNWGNDGNYAYNYSGLTRDQGTPAPGQEAPCPPCTPATPVTLHGARKVCWTPCHGGGGAQQARAV